MKRELGIARCGLACCLCSENEQCGGCDSGHCPDYDWCETRKCSLEKGLAGCWLCEDISCRKGFCCAFLAQERPRLPGVYYAGGCFLVFIKRLRGIILLGFISNGADGLAVQAELGMVAK